MGSTKCQYQACKYVKPCDKGMAVPLVTIQFDEIYRMIGMYTINSERFVLAGQKEQGINGYEKCLTISRQ